MSNFAVSCQAQPVAPLMNAPVKAAASKQVATPAEAPSAPAKPAPGPAPDSNEGLFTLAARFELMPGPSFDRRSHTAFTGIQPVTRLAASAPAPQTVASINQTFARRLEALKQNPELAKDPAAMRKAVRDLHDEHIGELAIFAADTKNIPLSEELGGHQETVNEIRSGAMHTRNSMAPKDASPEQIEEIKAYLENALYECLISEMNEAQ